MDGNLLQATVMLALYERKAIPTDTLQEYCKVYFSAAAYPKNILEFAELLGRTGQADYDDTAICKYVKALVKAVAEPFGHGFTEEEMCLIASYISARQAAFRSVDLFKQQKVVDRMMGEAEKIDAYAKAKNLGMFFFAYKLESFVLRSILQQFPANKELAYTIVKKLNGYQALYDSVQFGGKDTQNV